MAKKGAVDPKWKRRDLARFAIALSDLALATETCELMLTERPGLAEPRYWAYHTAIVNAYARPFTENKPLGKLPESVVKILDADERELHNEILIDRKTASAHSDLAAKPVYYMPRGARMFETGEHAEGGGFVTSRTAWTFDRWERVHALTQSVGGHVQGQAFRLVTLVYGDLYLPEPVAVDVD
jgi:hypothetical protein